MSLPTSLFLSHQCIHANFKKFAEGKKAQVEGNMLAFHRLDGQLTVYIIEIFHYFLLEAKSLVLNHRVHAKVSAFPKVILKRALHVRNGGTWSEEQFMKL